jgi:hypothetical protein
MIKKIAKGAEKVEGGLEKLAKSDKKRDKKCEYGEKMMATKKNKKSRK